MALRHLIKLSNWAQIILVCLLGPGTTFGNYCMSRLKNYFFSLHPTVYVVCTCSVYIHIHHLQCTDNMYNVYAHTTCTNTTLFDGLFVTSWNKLFHQNPSKTLYLKIPHLNTKIRFQDKILPTKSPRPKSPRPKSPWKKMKNKKIIIF